MAPRTASVLVCDEVLFNITGKAFLQGVYPIDITIPGNELSLGQLVFYFSIETDRKNPIKTLALKVVPPGEKPSQLEVSLATVPPPSVNPDRPRMMLRAPLLVQQMVLRPGKIETKVITELEELDAGGIWIISVPKRQELA
jgi:hypothetical protein